jgi:hypothetical protein
VDDFTKAILAVDAAVKTRALSLNPASPKWAGHFLYVGVERQDGQALNKFIHTTTKRPIWVKVTK